MFIKHVNEKDNRLQIVCRRGINLVFSKEIVCMRNTLEYFDRIVKKLLEDESVKPMAEYVPSQELYNRLDLSLDENGISEEKFEEALTD